MEIEFSEKQLDRLAQLIVKHLTAQQEELLTIEEKAEQLRVSVSTLRRMVKRGEIDVYKGDKPNSPLRFKR